MKRAFVFPGQGAQFPGMGRSLYDGDRRACALMENANDILGFRITDVMFGGDESALAATEVTQPAIFLHSVALAGCTPVGKPDMVGGHSLGEFSALVAAGAVSFEDGLRLVAARARAMHSCCERTPGLMAAVIGSDEATVESICASVQGVVVAANFNSPAQTVISGESEAVLEACEALKAAGARRTLPLKVGGAFHSPLMEPARRELAEAIAATPFSEPSCPIYQNFDGRPETGPAAIKEKLLAQLTSPVRWTATMQNMLSDGASSFVEIGPGSVLQGLLKRLPVPEGVTIEGIQ
ncbi:MAG: ACP S-malonyltransferase [Bacteroidales bacterium]|nr:ACP S-malonyltransferase [Bacteroidales bacterium]